MLRSVLFIFIGLSIPTLAKWPANTKPFGRAVLIPKSGSLVTGTVEFARSPKGLLIKADFAHLPSGSHGFHVHEKGDCSADDASSAGEHYNPLHERHGSPQAEHHHAGDLGNVLADETGSAHLEATVSSTNTGFSSWESLVGKSVVLHERADDFTTQPSGDSGKRIACGIIRPLSFFSE